MHYAYLGDNIEAYLCPFKIDFDQEGQPLKTFLRLRTKRTSSLLDQKAGS